MPTTTFVDVKITESLENYRHEKQTYNFSEGDVVSLPQHTASRFVNKWGYAEYDSVPYDVDNEDYDAVICRLRNDSESENVEVDRCNVEKSDGEICKREKPCPYHDDE